MLFYGFLLLLSAIIFYILNVVLIPHYIQKQIPGLMEIDASLPPPGKDEEYLWEKTAGTGIVPKWVSVIGLLAIPLGLIGILLIVVSFL